MTALCPACETVAHCAKHGCIPVSGDAPVPAAHRVVCDGSSEATSNYLLDGIQSARDEFASWPPELRAAARVTQVLEAPSDGVDWKIEALRAATPYCLGCEKEGHRTNECHSTSGFNAPRDMEISRLAWIANGHLPQTNKQTAPEGNGPVTYLRGAAGLHAWSSWEICGPDDANGFPVYGRAPSPIPVVEAGPDDGGPAFPATEANGLNNGMPGMSLRDYFAGRALAGICAHVDTWGLGVAGIATSAYELADAMLKARAPK